MTQQKWVKIKPNEIIDISQYYGFWTEDCEFFLIQGKDIRDDIFHWEYENVRERDERFEWLCDVLKHENVSPSELRGYVSEHRENTFIENLLNTIRLQAIEIKSLNEQIKEVKG